MPQLIKSLKLSEQQKFCTFLGIYSILAIAFNPSSWLSLLVVLTVGVSAYLINKKFLAGRKNFYNTLISLLIIFLVWHHSSDLIGLALVTAIVLLALSLKYFGQYKNFSITNPAATGILIISLINDYFGLAELSFASWWGASFAGLISLALVLAWTVYGSFKFKKLPIILVFLPIHLLLAFLMHGFDYFWFILTDATIYFYLAIMLIDPKSSPIKKSEQIIYALITLAAWHSLSYFEIANYELWAILAANFYHFYTKYSFFKQIEQKK